MHHDKRMMGIAERWKLIIGRLVLVGMAVDGCGGCVLVLLDVASGCMCVTQ